MLGFLGIAAVILGISGLKRAAAWGVTAPKLPLAGIITGSMGMGEMLFTLIVVYLVD
jgi:hypothetical protein